MSVSWQCLCLGTGNGFDSGGGEVSPPMVILLYNKLLSGTRFQMKVNKKSEKISISAGAAQSCFGVECWKALCKMKR